MIFDLFLDKGKKGASANTSTSAANAGNMAPPRQQPPAASRQMRQ